MESNDMPCAVRAAARRSSRQTRWTVESSESEDGGVIEEPREDGGCGIVPQHPAWGGCGNAYAAAVTGGAMTAQRAMLAVRAGVAGVVGGVGGVGRGRLAGRRIGSKRQRRHQEEREQELR
jgi:hypothetical protein